MIQIIPENRRHRKSLGNSVLEGAARAIPDALKQYQEMLRYNAENKSYSQSLGHDLSRDPEIRKQEIVHALRGQRATEDQNRLRQSFQNIQNMYNDPNLSEEQKTFGMYQELHQNPTLAHNLQASLNQQGKKRGENVAGRQFSTGYNAILEGDNEALMSVLDDPTTPLNVKQKLTALRDKQETRKSVQDRELRSRQGLVQKSYRQAIESERKKIAGDIYISKKDVEAINKRIKKLEALQKVDLKRLSKDADAYGNLHLWNMVDQEFYPEEEMELADEAGMSKQEVQENPEVQERVEFLNSKFSPQEFSGKKKKDRNGRVYQSDGNVWRLVQE